MSDEEFEKQVALALDELPSWVKEKLTNVVFLVRVRPTRSQRKFHQLSQGESLYGLYEGVPLSERGNEAPLYPDTVTIFSEPIRSTYANAGDIQTCIQNTIWHEIAHYFGYDEEWVAYEENRRGKIL